MQNFKLYRMVYNLHGSPTVVEGFQPENLGDVEKVGIFTH